MPRTSRDCLGSVGSVAAEFAFAAPILVMLVVGIADFGVLTARSAALAGATRAGAEYARNSSTCKADLGGTSCIAGIKSVIQSAISSGPALTFPSTFPPICKCDDGSDITCGTTCVGAGKVPNRVSIAVTATQAFTPIVPWPGFPTSVTKSTEIRVQ
jgi:Flp pilus assembly protein TadG